MGPGHTNWWAQVILTDGTRSHQLVGPGHTNWWAQVIPTGGPRSHQLMGPGHTNWWAQVIPTGGTRSHQLMGPGHTNWWAQVIPADGTKGLHANWCRTCIWKRQTRRPRVRCARLVPVPQNLGFQEPKRRLDFVKKKPTPLGGGAASGGKKSL